MIAKIGMSLIFLLGLSIILFIIGMIKPSIIVRWGQVRERKQVVKYYGTGTLVIFILVVSLIIFDSNRTTQQTQKTTNTTQQTSTQTQSSDNKTQQPNTQSQKELNDKIKKEAVKADFVQLNGHEDEYKNKKVFIEGTVEVLKEQELLGEFTMSTKEGNGYGMYSMNGIDTENDYKIGKDIKKGDKIKVYGTIGGKDKLGMPKIDYTIIEKE